MSKYYYDLHIHSCLSPCADDDMTPANIAGMAAVKGLQIAALTDHNTTANCPAFFAACKRHGIIPVAGMELTTSEEIHLLCLFSGLEEAMAFGDEVARSRAGVRNRPDIFGHQYVMDENDNILSEEENLLINATQLSLAEGTALCRKHGGVCHPAHIDRDSGGVIAVLGVFPREPGYTSYEISSSGSREEILQSHGMLERLTCVKSSDAHYLWDISEAENSFEINDEPYSGALVRRNLIRLLSGENV